LHPQLRVQLFERHAVMERLLRVDPSEVANFSSWIVPARETQSLLDRARQRWLEFLIRQDVTRVDPSLDPLFAYAQVLAGTVGDAESWTFCARRAPVAWPSSN
jgi:hypothetical protein